MMNRLENAARQALEALISAQADEHRDGPFEYRATVIDALSEALAEQQPGAIPDCGEAGHADGACGTRECLPSFSRNPTQQAAEPNAVLVEGFGRVALRKLNDLREKGYAINGVSIATISEAGETNRGAVTTGGMVLWWPAQQAAEPVAQKPYAYEYGVDNGDGTYSIQIDRGSLIHTGVQYEYCAPRNPHPEHPVKPLYTHPAPTRQPLTDDTRRLEWLMLTVSGAELRRIGVCYVNNCTREDIDSAILASAAAHGITGGKEGGAA